MTLLHPAEPPPSPLAPLPQLRVSAHDQSRVEWVVTTPMAAPDFVQNYLVSFDIEIPDAIWVAHDPWQRYQVRTRLTSPALATAEAREARDPRDQLRLRALAVARALKLATQLPSRILAGAHRRDGVLQEAEATAIVADLERALAMAAGERDQLRKVVVDIDPSLEREQRLADEYISGQVLLLVSAVRSAMQRPRGRRVTELRGAIQPLATLLAKALQAEHSHRHATAIRQPAPHTPKDVEAYVNRAAQLKKHFQQALFLDATAYMLDERLRNWIAAAVAMVAAVFYFAWQVSVLNAATTGATTVSLALAAIVGALVYAAKDRIKEVGRTWLADKLKHTYADRVVHLRLQARTDPQRQDFVLARETITVLRQLQPDHFNPELGRTTLVHHLRIRERLRHRGLALLHQQGLLGLKHVFRYDLSPLLAKLDDHEKAVPVLGPHGVMIRSGSRVYVLPVVARLCRQDGDREVEVQILRGHLLLRGRRLVRFSPREPHAGPEVSGDGLVPPAPGP